MQTFVNFILIFLLSIISFQIKAQEQGQNIPANRTIQGIVIDSISGLPLEFASVAAFRMLDSIIVSGAITNSNGFFSIPQISPGRYKLSVTFVGYKTKEFGPFMFSPQAGEVLDVGKIYMQISASSLNAFEIVGDKPFIEMNLDRKVVNVEGNITIAGGTAIDVLETVPSVTVDMDGNVSFRGSENVTILIDGRPANFGSSRKAVLEQIPANMIESIELITNPSAKYNPEGTSGIINIVLKARKGQNTSVNTTINANTRMGYSGNIAVQHGFNKLNLYANYDYRNDIRFMEGKITRYSYINPVYLHEQIFESEDNSERHSLKFGADYFLNAKNTLGFSMNANISNSLSESFNNNTEWNNSLLFLRNYRNVNLEDNYYLLANGNLYYTKKFDNPNRLLQFDLNVSNGSFESITEQNKNFYTQDWILIDLIDTWIENIGSESVSRTILGKIDYTHPITDSAKIEIGTHLTMRKMDSDNKYFSGIESAEELLLDTIRSNSFIFRENVVAAYANYIKTLNAKWSFTTGLRFEYAQSDPSVNTDTVCYMNEYFSLYPTAALSRKIKKGEELQLTYSKRVNRPDFDDLNPFIDYSNSPNLRGGNPYLNPEYIHSFELAYMKLWKTTSFMPSMFFKRTNDLISRYRVNYLDTFSLATYKNIASANSYGFELILNQTITKNWRVNLSASLFHTKINGENISPELTSDGFSYSGNLNTNIKFHKKLDLQLNAMYRGPRIMLQGKRDGMFFVNAGFRYQAIENKLIFSMNMRDIFNTMKFGVNMQDETFYFDIYRKWHSRVLTVGLTWQINAKSLQTEKRRGRPDNNAMPDYDMF